MSNANLVTPVSNIASASPFHAVTWQEVFIDPNPVNKEVYKQGGFFDADRNWAATYALSNVGLAKLMNAAGIEEMGNGRTDNREHPHVCSWQFSAKWTQPDSTVLTYSSDYELDLRDYIYVNGATLRGPRFDQAFVTERDDVLAEHFKKELAQFKGEARRQQADKLYRELPDDERTAIDEQAEAKALRYIVQMRQFIVQRSQTGAMERVVRKMLNLKASYTLEELKQPFRVPRSRFDWERMDAVLGTEAAKQLREVKAMELLGISPDTLAQYRQLAAPKSIHPANPEEPSPPLDVSEDFQRHLAEQSAPPDAPASQPSGSAVLPEAPMEFIEGVLTYCYESGTKMVGYGSKWKPAGDQVALAKGAHTAIMGLFKNEFEAQNHLKKHFKGVSTLGVLTWEELCALIEWKKHGRADPRWYSDKIKADDLSKNPRYAWCLMKYGFTEPLDPKEHDFLVVVLSTSDPLFLSGLLEAGWTWADQSDNFLALAKLVAEGKLEYGSEEFTAAVMDARKEAKNG